jgi:hypothetical protein
MTTLLLNKLVGSVEAGHVVIRLYTDSDRTCSDTVSPFLFNSVFTVIFSPVWGWRQSPPPERFFNLSNQVFDPNISMVFFIFTNTI